MSEPKAHEYTCPITGEGFRSGMTMKKLLGADKVCRSALNNECHGYLEVFKNGRSRIFPVRVDLDYWSWEFVAKIRKFTCGQPGKNKSE